MSRLVFTPDFMMELLQPALWDFHSLEKRPYRGKNGEYELRVVSPTWWEAKLVVDGTTVYANSRNGDYLQVDLMAPDSVERLHQFMRKL
jgi:hypothetical protein